MISRSLWPAVGLAIALAGCNSSEAVSPTSTPSSKPVAQPTTVSPATARINAVMRFGTNPGTTVETLAIKITTDIPVDFNAYPALTVNDSAVPTSELECATSGAPPSQGLCDMHGTGDVAEVDLISTGATLPHGTYVFTLVVPPSSGQVSNYTEWVGGATGALLSGNPQAVTHAGVIDLQTTVTATH